MLREVPRCDWRSQIFLVLISLIFISPACQFHVDSSLGYLREVRTLQQRKAVTVVRSSGEMQPDTDGDAAFNTTLAFTRCHSEQDETNRIIDQEGRQWRTSKELKRFRRDGLKEAEERAAIRVESPDGKVHKIRRPWNANMGKHTMMLRDSEKGESKNEKKGRFVLDEERWLHRYDALCRFHERYGHTNVPFRKIKPPDASSEEKNRMDELKAELGGFVEEEEEDDDDGEYDYFLPADVGSDSSIIYMTDEFTEPYTRLVLGYWVAQQRHFYRYYSRTRMTPWKVSLLNKLNFTWDRTTARWDTQYEKLRAFYNHNGHVFVRQNTTLGHWVYKQRWYNLCIQRGDTLDLADILRNATLDDTRSEEDVMEEIVDVGGGKKYRGKPVSPLTPERRTKLDAINFVWDHDDAVWKKNFQDLINYKEKHNTTRVPSKYPTLGKWVRKHRAEWRRLNLRAKERDGEVLETPAARSLNDLAINATEQYTFLTPDRIARLNAVGFEWVVREYSWEDHYDHLRAYKDEFGHVNVPQSFDDPEKYPKLGKWLTAQRTLGRKFLQGKLGKSQQMTKGRFKPLDALGVVWDPVLHKFQLQLKELKAYRDTHGHMNVPSTVPKLYSWLRKTKKEYAKMLNGEPSKIDMERRKLLDELDFAKLM